MENNNLEERMVSLEKRVQNLEDKLSSGSEDIILKNPKKLSVKEFLMSKKINNDVERTLAIAYFLEHFEGMGSFNIDDIKKGFISARVPCPTNINDKVNMNIKNGHIMEAEEKKDAKKAWTLTATGENFVETELNAKGL